METKANMESQDSRPWFTPQGFARLEVAVRRVPGKASEESLRPP